MGRPKGSKNKLKIVLTKKTREHSPLRYQFGNFAKVICSCGQWESGYESLRLRAWKGWEEHNAKSKPENKQV